MKNLCDDHSWSGEGECPQCAIAFPPDWAQGGPAQTPQAAGAIDAREQDGVQWLPWQAITEDVLSEHERFLVDGSVKQAAFFPVDANRLANIALHCIREVRAARIALASPPEAPPAAGAAQASRKVVPINVAQDAPQDGGFDADVLRIMFQECGATIYEGGHENTIYIPHDFFAKLAAALNNLP